MVSADHAEIFLRLGAQHFRDVQQPRLADDGDDGRFRLEDEAHQVVLLDGNALAARHAERGDLRIFPFCACGLFEELHVLRVAAGPAAFNVLNPEESSFSAMRSLSRAEKLMPSPCAPSRRVVS